jgi:hypothetical protein
MYSPLIDQKMPPTGKAYINGRWVEKWSARPSGVKINGLNVHHWAGTGMSGLDRLVKSSDPASTNYLILNDGTLIGSVPEEYRAWTTSAYVNDDDKITVEIQNETGGPSWRISDAAMATLIRLYADCAKRHKFSPVRANLKGHQEYGIATACPGPYLLPRLDDVARKAAASLITVAPTTTEPRPFHTEWAIRPTQVRETPGGTVVRTLQLGDSASVIDGSGTKADGWTHWWGETTTGNWVCLTDMSEARPYHTREVTTETHPYDQPGTGMQDRVLAVGARFTVWDGSAVEVDDVWWIQSTAGNWFRSTDTRKIISNPEG